MIKEGKIVPSEVTIKLLQRAMDESGNDKFLIDGFPRNEENRAAFELVVSFPSYLSLSCAFGQYYEPKHFYLLYPVEIHSCAVNCWEFKPGYVKYTAKILVLLQTGIEPAFVLFFDCSEEEMERRLLGRNQVRYDLLKIIFLILSPHSALYNVFHSFFRVYSFLFFQNIDSFLPRFFCVKGREDDNIETIRKRFKVFLESSLPVVEHYNSTGKVRKVL